MFQWLKKWLPEAPPRGMTQDEMIEQLRQRVRTLERVVLRHEDALSIACDEIRRLGRAAERRQ